MTTHKLSADQFRQTFQAPMLDMTDTAEPPLDIWPYVEAVPETDLGAYPLLDRIVPHVWQSASGQFEHVLVATVNADVFLVIVVDRFDVKIVGHRLLNLLDEYGLA